MKKPFCDICNSEVKTNDSMMSFTNCGEEWTSYADGGFAKRQPVIRILVDFKFFDKQGDVEAPDLCLSCKLKLIGELADKFKKYKELSE